MTPTPQSGPAAAGSTARLRTAGYLLGFGTGGIFDGILLHQLLQWHHLLSGVGGAQLRDLRVQVLVDGVFHTLMYAIAAAGLRLLWRSRRRLAESGTGRPLLAAFLIGFGGWHVVDGILFHWLLGFHRIRMAAENPLLWDLLFFVPGLVLMLVGWRLLRRGGREREETARP